MFGDEQLKLKQDLRKLCLGILEDRMENARFAVDEIEDLIQGIGGTSEESDDDYINSKRLELEMLSKRLMDARDELKRLQRMRIEEEFREVGPGAVVMTDEGNFFVAVGLGVIHAQGGAFMGISALAPIYLAMAGKKSGEKFSFREKHYQIRDIF